VFASEQPVTIEPPTRDLDLGQLVLETGAALAGVVRDGAQVPLAGVKIRLGRQVEEPIWLGFGGESAVTGSDGRFRFDGLRAGTYRLSTASSRHVPASHKVVLERGQDRDDVSIELREGGYVAGVVLDDLGAPVAGARVAPLRQRGGEFLVIEGFGAGSEGAETDAQGRFFLGGLEDEKVALRATSKHHASTTRREVPLRAADVVLQLRRHGSIEGVLVDTAGKPIAGSTVSFSAQGAPLFVRLPGGGPDDNKTRADGGFTLRGVPPGRVQLNAQGDAHVDAGPLEVEVRAGETVTGVKLIAQRGAAIEALVADGDGRPVQGADVVVARAGDGPGRAGPAPGGGTTFRARRVTRRIGGSAPSISFDDQEELGRAKTDADGKARIAGLEAGDVRVSVKHDELVAQAPARLTLPGVGVVETKLTAVRGGFADVRVVDADGAPVKQASVVVEPKEGEGLGEQGGVTDADGRTRVGPLAPGAWVATLKQEPKPMEVGGGARVLIAGQETRLEATARPFTVREGETVELAMTRPITTTVVGVVTDAAGPVAGAQVGLQPEGEPRFGVPGSPYSARTDRDGRYRIPDLAAGKYTISWSRADAAVPFEQPIELLPGERELRRNLSIAGGVVKVTVHGHDAQPLRAARVRLEQESSGGGRRVQAVMMMIGSDHEGEAMSLSSGAGRPVTTDEDGQATIRDVPPGKYTVVVEHARHVERKKTDVQVGADATVDLGIVALAAGGQVRGTVVAPDGAQPAAFGVENVSYQRVGDTGQPKTTTALNYAFKLNGLEPGRWKFWTTSFGGEQPRSGPPVEVEVKAGETAAVQVQQAR
jgi:protocatechuate 3,4-dioxygenase beta subunit